MVGTPHASRVIQYHASNLRFDGAQALQREIVRFVGGIRGPRQNPVSKRHIIAWFSATKPEFVNEQIGILCMNGTLRCLMRSLSSNRRHNGAYVYEVA